MNTLQIPSKWKGRYRVATPGGAQEMLCLSEHGLYFFLNRSDKPKAFPFKDSVLETGAAIETALCYIESQRQVRAS